MQYVPLLSLGAASDEHQTIWQKEERHNWSDGPPKKETDSYLLYLARCITISRHPEKTKETSGIRCVFVCGCVSPRSNHHLNLQCNSTGSTWTAHKPVHKSRLFESAREAIEKEWEPVRQKCNKRITLSIYIFQKSFSSCVPSPPVLLSVLVLVLSGVKEAASILLRFLLPPCLRSTCSICLLFLFRRRCCCCCLFSPPTIPLPRRKHQCHWVSISLLIVLSLRTVSLFLMSSASVALSLGRSTPDLLAFASLWFFSSSLCLAASSSALIFFSLSLQLSLFPWSDFVSWIKN